ncbi:MAG: hypothetical protein ACI4OI_00625 [Gemmiger sp.]
MKDDWKPKTVTDWESIGRELPGDLEETAQRELESLTGLHAVEPYSPADAHEMGSREDPLGSWTGVPHDPYTTPTQDADDL